jgi:hypothetical protein
MKTKEEWNSKILNITLKIKEQYPELSKYLEEMPITIPDKKFPIITPKILQDYFNSLTALLNNYLLEEFCNNEID